MGMSQNSMRYNWTREEVDGKLDTIMVNIHKECVAAAKEYGMPGNYVAGANIAGFKKVANAMLAQGLPKRVLPWLGAPAPFLERPNRGAWTGPYGVRRGVSVAGRYYSGPCDDDLMNDDD